MDIFYDRLVGKVHKQDVFENQDLKISLPAFKLDEDGLAKYSKDETRKMSVREYMGMMNWPVCDYILFDTGASNQPMIFIVEKTDLILSAMGIKEDSKKYKSIKSSVDKGIAQSDEFKENSQVDVARLITNNFVDKIIVDELVDENKNKLYSSLYLLCRLQNDKEFRDLLTQHIEYHFILLVLPNKDARSGSNSPAIFSKLKSELDKRLKRMGILIRDDIQSKQYSEVNPDKSVKIIFSGIKHGPKEFLNYLKAKSNTEYIKIDKLPS